MNEFLDAPNAARRIILKGAVAGSLTGFAFDAFPFPAFADADAKDWPGDAFKSKSEAAGNGSLQDGTPFGIGRVEKLVHCILSVVGPRALSACRGNR